MVQILKIDIDNKVGSVNWQFNHSTIKTWADLCPWTSEQIAEYMWTHTCITSLQVFKSEVEDEVNTYFGFGSIHGKRRNQKYENKIIKQAKNIQNYISI